MHYQEDEVPIFDRGSKLGLLSASSLPGRPNCIIMSTEEGLICALMLGAVQKA